MGIYPVECYVCKTIHPWFSGNVDQRCLDCIKNHKLPEGTMVNVTVIPEVRKDEREKAVQAVMDLYYSLKHIGGKPTLKDLVKLAKRIRGKS